jgi:chromosome segregation ATPase
MGKLTDFFTEQHIVLAGQNKATMLSLDHQFEELEAERDSLKTENLDLKGQVKALGREVDQLKQRIPEQAGKPISAEKAIHLDETEIRLLKYLAVFIPEEMPLPNLRQVSAFLEMNPITAEVVLKKLEKQKLVFFNGSGSQWLYGLAEDGKQYLVDKKIL